MALFSSPVSRSFKNRSQPKTRNTTTTSISTFDLGLCPTSRGQSDLFGDLSAALPGEGRGSQRSPSSAGDPPETGTAAGRQAQGLDPGAQEALERAQRHLVLKVPEQFQRGGRGRDGVRGEQREPRGRRPRHAGTG